MNAHNESARLHTLATLRVLDTPADPVLDELVRAAASHTDCPMALISLVDRDRQWFKARVGVEFDELPRGTTFCDEAIHHDALLEVEDAGHDPRFADNPVVMGEPFVRFYAGVPLVIDGVSVGVLCVLDRSPRVLDAGQRFRLIELARVVQNWMINWRSAAQLGDTRRFLSTMARQVPGMFLQLDLGEEGQANVSYASEGVREIFEYSPRDLCQTAALMLDRIHPDDRSRICLAVENSARNQTSLVQECRVCLPRRGTRWIEGHATPERREGGKVVWSGFIHDITERRELEQLRVEKLARDRSDQANREFVTTLSHELRTPLNAVFGFTQLMQADPSLPARAQAQLGHIRTASEQLLQLVDDILVRARGDHVRQSTRLLPVQLRPVLEASLALIDPQAKLRGVRIEPTRGPLDLTVRANSRALGQVLLNLLSNAVKYNRDHGRAWVEVLVDGSMVGLCICDEGKGLSEEMKQRLFRPFDRLGEEAGQIVGSGLGLVICKQLVEDMAGRLEVQSSAESGSRFTVWLAAERSAH